MPEIRKILGLLFLVGVMCVKVSALHVYAHQDSDLETIENCDICEIALENQTESFNFDLSTEVNTPSIFPVSYKILKETDQVSGLFNHYSYFSRPPPGIL
ncbi:hypothetical protein [Flagellimonas allohymeniacidonis]|uniref:Uncharacterized protein n=1 Tax=Flagellimonas allohymeniacidonis TaxID=2517819 RepID=A0A4Q8QKE0_9FLAO|nr:hypothetical protein [Allomuricauda hymeniacidonis]TAI48706.1 hypothetical protein EW142_02585 [Allomuricauda hymeniacidonis]